VPHFGVVLTFEDWNSLAERVEGFIDGFIIKPYIRFKGEPGEQGTMFFSDPSGNSLEFKAFKNIGTELFAK
jgi:extradiol dioxygenase family protein